VVDDHIEVRALVHHIGEGAQLEGGAGQLAAEPAGAERGLGVGGGDHLVGVLLQECGGPAQQPGPCATVGERGERGGRGTDRGVDVRGRGLVADLLALLPGSGVDAPDWYCHRKNLHIRRTALAAVRYAEQSLQM